MRAGDLVREARRRAGLTQVELAARVGTTQSAIARLESSATAASFESMQKAVRACGFRLDVMLEPYDDSDIAQAEALLALSVEERLERMAEGISFAEELRSARAGAT